MKNSGRKALWAGGEPKKRVFPTARMKPGTDPAAFDKEALSRIWQSGDSYPACVFNGVTADAWHHVFGHGEEFGAKKRSYERRHMFSSVFNALPLTEEPHARYAMLNHPKQREVFFDHLYRVDMNAVAAGRYELTDVDVAFLNWQERDGIDVVAKLTE